MGWLDAVLLGILEGLTEFLPVSSTGHLILLGDRLGHTDEAAKTLEIVIQLGAVLAVVAYFRKKLAAILGGAVRRDAASLRLMAALAIGFVPAAVVGLALHKAIKARLFGPGPVAAALIAGGAAMIAIEAMRRRPRATASGSTDLAAGAAAVRAADPPGLDGLEHITPKRALAIGLAQCLALWPGASRSMTTIVGGQLSGLSTATAAEFSFLLAIPTLGAATVFDMAKNGRALLAAPGGTLALLVGMSVALAVSLLVIAAFLRYLRRFGLAPFGAYRIALGIAVLVVLGWAVPHAPAEARGEAASAQTRAAGR